MRIKIDSGNLFLAQVPDAPGVYRYYDREGELLYVGKALNLFKRVKSYFQKTAQLSPRIHLMVKKIVEIEITVTENETSALLLESNLIKSLKPKYNIIFRDDKSYPYIKLSKHQFPLIEYFRGKPLVGEYIFGPYPNPYAVRETLDLLQRLFKLRTCSDAVFANRSRPCMLYQVNLCCAPCVAKVSIEEYHQFISYARDFLLGNYGDLIGKLSTEMYRYAENMEFEQAGALRDKIGLVKQMQSKQIISDSQTPLDCDIILFHEAHAVLYIYVIIVRNGLYVGDKHFFHRIHDDCELLQEAFLERYYSESLAPKILYLNLLPTTEFAAQFQQIYKTRLFPIKNGRIYELAEMGKKNLDKIIENSQLDNIYQSACSKLSSMLQLAKINRIECYDTSHHQGSSAIASMVVYSHGKIDHALYRKYNLPDEVNGNDLLALEHVLRRRLLNQELALPEVILVDGGALQLNCAKNLIAELGFCDKIKTIAIFKGEHRNPLLDRIIITSALELGFREEPTIFKLLQALRDEAHRFAITGHRKKQAERMRHSRLEDIPGVGAIKRKSLIAFFGSANAVAEASIAELQQIDGIGSELASVIYNFFHS